MTNSNLIVCVSILLTCMCVMQCQKPSPALDSTPQPNVEVKKIHVRQAWIKMDKDLKSAVSKIIRRAMPVLMKEIYKKEVSTSCLGGLMALSNGLKQTKLWAYQLLDASGKFPEGFLSGTLTSLGNYEECVGIKVDEKKLKVKGQYCILNLMPPLPTWKPFTSLHLQVPELFNISAPDTVISFLAAFLHNLHVTTVKIGLCTPSMCTMDDINRLVQIVPEKLGIPWEFEVSHCETREVTEFTTTQLISLYVMSILAVLVLIGTLVDWIWTSEDMERSSLKATIFHILKAFSFTSNGKKLSNFTGPQDNPSFVYGLVFIVFLWVAISNTFMYVNYNVASNFVRALTILKNLFFEIALNRILPLQTLFYVSGFLTTYRWLKTPEKSMNIIKFLLKKYWRYTPAYGLILALVILTPTWGSGPTWFNHLDPVYRNCKDNWWYNILYINNFIGTERACLDHTWVFAVAAQLHVLAIFILVPLKMHPKIGLMINFVLAVASFASVALTNVYYDLPPNEMTAMLHPKDRYFYAEHTYYRVYTHVGIYCTGIFVGYLMAKHPDIKICKRTTWCLWLVTLAGLLTALCSVHEWKEGNVTSPLLGAVYTTFSKVAEAAFLAWLSVACMTGHSGGVNAVLSWQPFAFLAKLTFVAYAMHVPVINMVMSFKKSHVFINYIEIFYIVLSHVAGTYIISYILHLCFEAPWSSLADVVKRRCQAKTFNSDNNQPISEKPFKYAEKPGKFQPSSSNWMNSLEKGQRH